jgi:hypothetical protein
MKQQRITTNGARFRIEFRMGDDGEWKTADAQTYDTFQNAKIALMKIQEDDRIRGLPWLPIDELPPQPGRTNA